MWRTLLEETDKLAKAKLAIVEVFQQQIADDAKVVRANKMQLAKKVSRPIYQSMVPSFLPFDRSSFHPPSFGIPSILVSFPAGFDFLSSFSSSLGS